MPTDRHQAIVGFLYVALLALVTKLGGALRFAPLRLRLWPGKIREPDLMMLRRADDPRRQEVYWNGADLVVEVVSEDDPERDLRTKRLEYAQAGIPEYWIVDPREGIVTVLRLSEESYEVAGRFGAEQEVVSETLGETRIQVSAVFATE